MKRILATLILGLAALALAEESPTLIPFQGRLTDQQGNAYTNGQYTLTFNVYDTAVGGVSRWAERHEKVGVVNGMVNVFLGSIQPFTTNVNFANTMYLGITIDADNLSVTADPEMVPRQMIIPAFFARNAAKMSGYDWSAILEGGVNNPTTAYIRGDRLAPNSITSDRIANGSITIDDMSADVVGDLTGTLVQGAPVPTFTAMEAISALDAVAVMKDSSNNVRIVRANSSIGSRSGFYGFAKSSVSAGSEVSVHQYGPLAGFSNLIGGSGYYVGTNDGAITTAYLQTPIYAGYAMASSVLFVDPIGTTKRWASGNYWGDGSDGVLNTSGNVSFASTQDGDVVVKQFTSLTINAGHTVTTSNRCRGLVIYVDGNCTINGTLSMTARGASANPTAADSINPAGIRLARKKSGSTDTLPSSDVGGAGTGGVGAQWRSIEALQPGIDGNGKIYVIARTGGTGAPSNSTTGPGSAGGTIADGTGGGGSGGNVSDAGSTRGGGGAGTCYSGGTGGGGRHGVSGGTGQANGGAGGTGGSISYSNAGGAGNPGGGYNAAYGGASGASGTGGLLCLFVRGSLTIGGTGAVGSNGSAGGGAVVSGGGSGGGRILILYAGALLNSGAVTANGGPKGTIGSGETGGDGGAGAVTIEQVDP